MSERRSTLLIGLCTAALACATWGCQPQLGRSEEAILSYLQNARVHGGVRRAWPGGQEYLDKVLKTDAQLQKALAALREFQDVYSLWVREDPRWRDTAELDARIKKLSKLLNNPDPDRQELLAKLADVVAQLPAGLNLPAGGEAAFIDRVWQALALQGTELGIDLRAAIPRLEQPVRMHLELARAVKAAAGEFDPARSGLAFADAARQQQIDQRYDALRRLLLERREEFVKHAEQRIAACRERIKTIDKRARRLDYEYLSNHEKYLREELEELLKRMAGMVAKLKHELAQLEKKARRAPPADKSTLDAKIAFTKQRIAQLEADRAQLKSRVDPLIRRPGAGGKP